jgi:transcriptional regulator with XRE-family HTH domain
MDARTDSEALRHRLRSELRRVRLRQGYTQEEVAQVMDWSTSKVIRIENGFVGISPNDLKVLLQHYQVTDERRVDELVDLARSSRRSGWASFRDIHSKSFLAYLSCESTATRIDEYQTIFVPGLLHTRSYARAVLVDVHGVSTAQEIERRWQARSRRQELHDQEIPPQMTFILDEAVLRRQFGGADVMRRQLQHLLDWAVRPHVSLRVVPFGAGGHAGLRAPSFSLLTLPDPNDSQLLYLESAADSTVIRDDTAEIDSYQKIFTAVRDVAMTEAESIAVIEALARTAG